MKIKLNGKRLCPTDSVTYLGAKIDKKLKKIEQGKCHALQRKIFCQCKYSCTWTWQPYW